MPPVGKPHVSTLRFPGNRAFLDQSLSRSPYPTWTRYNEKDRTSSSDSLPPAHQQMTCTAAHGLAAPVPYFTLCPCTIATLTCRLNGPSPPVESSSSLPPLRTGSRRPFALSSTRRSACCFSSFSSMHHTALLLCPAAISHLTFLDFRLRLSGPRCCSLAMAPKASKSAAPKPAAAQASGAASASGSHAANAPLLPAKRSAPPSPSTEASPVRPASAPATPATPEPATPLTPTLPGTAAPGTTSPPSKAPAPFLLRRRSGGGARSSGPAPLHIAIHKYCEDGSTCHESFEPNAAAYILLLQQAGNKAAPSVLYQLKTSLEKYIAAMHQQDTAMPASLMDLVPTSDH